MNHRTRSAARALTRTTVMNFIFLIWLALIVAGAVGWIWNIVRIVWYLQTDAANEMILQIVIRGIGILVAPAGAIMGYIPF